MAKSVKKVKINPETLKFQTPSPTNEGDIFNLPVNVGNDLPTDPSIMSAEEEAKLEADPKYRDAMDKYNQRD